MRSTIQTVIDSSRIAEFMCYPTVLSEEGLVHYEVGDSWLRPIDLPFNRDWNYLIPVLVKCREIKSVPMIGEAVATLDIEVAFAAAVTHIRRYESERKK